MGGAGRSPDASPTRPCGGTAVVVGRWGYLVPCRHLTFLEGKVVHSCVPARGTVSTPRRARSSRSGAATAATAATTSCWHRERPTHLGADFSRHIDCAGYFSSVPQAYCLITPLISPVSWDSGGNGRCETSWFKDPIRL